MRTRSENGFKKNSIQFFELQNSAVNFATFNHINATILKLLLQNLKNSQYQINENILELHQYH